MALPNLTRMCKEEEMPEIQVQEQIRSLHSQNPNERLRAAVSLGKLGARVRETNETLASDYRGAIVSLAGALRDQESSLIRAEAAWALGQIGGIAAMRRLLPRIEEVYPAPGAGTQVLGDETPAQEEPANTRAALIAAAGQALTTEELASLDAHDIASLAQTRESLLRQLAIETDDDVRVAIVETLVVLSVRTQKAGLDVPADLSPLLCGGDEDAILAAVALLKEIAPDAHTIATQWHRRTGIQEPDPGTNALIDAWELRLGDCRPDRSTLLEWLDLAAIVWDLQTAAELVA
jgi:hypothetical protein